MIVVEKGEEPEGLKELREECKKQGLSPKDSFKMLRNPLKEQVIGSLKRDQGQLCVYCMSRIPRADRDPGIMGQTIEHYVPLDPADGRDVGQGLDYQNLFAVCHGNMKIRTRGVRRSRSESDLTCDKHRGNTEFRKINPCDKDTLASIFYTLDGKIDSEDKDVHYDLVDRLNLNCTSSPIVEERRAALDELIINLGSITEDELKQYCLATLESFYNETTSKTPYVGALIWYLQSMVESLNRENT